MESWRKVWREGFLPQFTADDLKIVLHALEMDDPTLVQGCTTVPPALRCLSDCSACSCCLISMIGWRSRGLLIVGELDGFFATICAQADRIVSDSGACRHFLNWFDDTPRLAMRAAMINELKTNLETIA